MTPPEVTFSPALAVVVVNVTVPVLPPTVTAGGANVADAEEEVDPVVADVWTRACPPGESAGDATISE
jgi:hypothetical protein